MFAMFTLAIDLEGERERERERGCRFVINKYSALSNEYCGPLLTVCGDREHSALSAQSKRIVSCF